MQVQVAIDDIADAMVVSPECTMAVLSCIAGTLANEPVVLRFCAKVASEHSGSVEDSMVSAFLRLLADALDAEEATFGQTDIDPAQTAASAMPGSR